MADIIKFPGGGVETPPPSGFLRHIDFPPTLTYRRLDYWTRIGLLQAVEPARGTGIPRYWPEVEGRIAGRMVDLIDKAGFAPGHAAVISRSIETEQPSEIEIAPGYFLRATSS